MTDHQPVL